MMTDLRILVTRSGESGVQLGARLAALGLRVVRYAPVEPGPVDDTQALGQKLLAVLPVDILLVPSAEALRQLAVLLDPPSWGAALTVVPGPGTAAVARRLGFTRVRFPLDEGSSERILELPDLAEVGGKRVLIAAAAGGRKLIETSLAQRGAVVATLEVYQRRLVPPGAGIIQALAQPEPVVTLLASGGALEALRCQLPEHCWQRLAAQPMIAPSSRVARLAEVAGCVEVSVAAAADDHSMLAELARLRPELVGIGYS